MIELRHVSMSTGPFSLRGITARIPTGTYAVLMGSTGCGKTSLMEAIIGLRPITGGEILLDGASVAGVKPARRGVGYVPQDRALFPTMTVRDHLGFALSIRGEQREVMARRTDELARELGIVHLLDRTPHGLSGGEAQRVALGRALSFHPRFLCLDEPLSAVDESLRDELCDLLKRLQKEKGMTVLHVTHGMAEARRMADVLFRLENGRLYEESR